MGTDSKTDLKPIDAAKVRAIASRLASDHDGEVIAAARALVRIAAAAGKRVEDLVAVPAATGLGMRGWPKTEHTSPAFGSTSWFNEVEARFRRAQSKRPNWKFIVDGLALVGKSGLLGMRDIMLVSAVKNAIDLDKSWTPPSVVAAVILELARRHGIVAE